MIDNTGINDQPLMVSGILNMFSRIGDEFGNRFYDFDCPLIHHILYRHYVDSMLSTVVERQLDAG